MRTPESRSFSGSKRPEKINKRPSLIEAASILTILATLGLTGKDALKAKSNEHDPTDVPAAEINRPPSSKKTVETKNAHAVRRDSARQTEITDEERVQRLMATLEEHVRQIFPNIRPDVHGDVSWSQGYDRNDDISTGLSIGRRHASDGSFHILYSLVHDGTYIYRAEFKLKDNEFSFSHLQIFDNEGSEDLNDLEARTMRLNVPADQMQNVPADTQSRIFGLVLQGLKEWEQNIEDGRWSSNLSDANM